MGRVGGGGSALVARDGGGISGAVARDGFCVGGAEALGGGGVAPKLGTPPDGGLGGKRGVVLAVGGEPVSGGADGRAAGVSEGVGAGGFGAREIVGIGLVTAVDHAGGTFDTGAGSNWLDVVFMGSVVAADMFGLGVGGIFPVAGRSGRGGKLIRRVSRFGVFASLPSGVGSAIDLCFYSVF